MAPEIRLNKKYDGRKIDVFSAGVVIFTLALGYFPFKQASMTDHFFKLLVRGKKDQVTGVNREYWAALKGEHLSDNFKLMMQ